MPSSTLILVTGTAYSLAVRPPWFLRVECCYPGRAVQPWQPGMPSTFFQRRAGLCDLLVAVAGGLVALAERLVGTVDQAPSAATPDASSQR